MMIEDIYEIAFGEDAIHNEYTQREVLETLMEYSDKALAWDTLQEWLSEGGEEDYKLSVYMDTVLEEIVDDTD